MAKSFQDESTDRPAHQRGIYPLSLERQKDMPQAMNRLYIGPEDGEKDPAQGLQGLAHKRPKMVDKRGF